MKMSKIEQLLKRNLSLEMGTVSFSIKMGLSLTGLKISFPEKNVSLCHFGRNNSTNTKSKTIKIYWKAHSWKNLPDNFVTNLIACFFVIQVCHIVGHYRSHEQKDRFFSKQTQIHIRLN